MGEDNVRYSAGSAFEGQVGGGHYRDMAIQPAEFIHRNGIGFIEGLAIRYLCRWRKKGGLEDLRKAKHAIELLLEMEIGHVATESAAQYDHGCTCSSAPEYIGPKDSGIVCPACGGY